MTENVSVGSFWKMTESASAWRLFGPQQRTCTHVNSTWNESARNIARRIRRTRHGYSTRRANARD